VENSYLENKIILKYCKDYYRIINEEFGELDYMSAKVIQVYQAFIFSINIKNKTDIKKITVLNDAVARFFDDREFKTFLTNFLENLKIAKGEKDIMRYISEAIISQYGKYMEGFTRNLYISRWI
jgi:hypothetical protein